MTTAVADKQALARPPTLVDFALQGGGAHGAFTWGVLDRLLEEPWLRIDGISGTSAGAMNAAVLVRGLCRRRRRGRARCAGEFLAQRLARRRRSARSGATPLDVLLGRWTLDNSPMFVAMDIDVAAVLALRPQSAAATNPLRDILAESVDFERLAQAPIKLFVTATNVRTGRGRVFRNAEITPDVLLASACLPTHVPGGRDRRRDLLGRRLFRQSRPSRRWCANATRSDTILVQINPVERPGTPRSARDILNRLNEVSFNAVLLKELRMIALLRQVADPGDCEGAHGPACASTASPATAMVELGYSSKLNAEWEFLCMLRDEGRRAAEAFLDAHRRRPRHALVARSRPAAGRRLTHGPCSASCSASAC